MPVVKASIPETSIPPPAKPLLMNAYESFIGSGMLVKVAVPSPDPIPVAINKVPTVFVVEPMVVHTVVPRVVIL